MTGFMPLLPHANFFKTQAGVSGSKSEPPGSWIQSHSAVWHSQGPDSRDWWQGFPNLEGEVSQILFSRGIPGTVFHPSEKEYGPHMEGSYMVCPTCQVLKNTDHLDDIMLDNVKRKHYIQALLEAVKEFQPGIIQSRLFTAVNQTGERSTFQE